MIPVYLTICFLVKQLAFRLDDLYLPKISEPNQPLYLVEVQLQPDHELSYRIFAELFILRTYAQSLFVVAGHALIG